MVNNKTKFYLLCVLYLCMGIACKTFFSKKYSTNSISSTPVRLTVRTAEGTKANLDLNPGRIYVSNQQNLQKPPKLILKVKGLIPGATVFWAFKYRTGRLKPNSNSNPAYFSGRKNHLLNRWNNSTKADLNGESEVFFSSTTYAGDSFKFGISLKEYVGAFKNEDKMSIQYRNSIKKTKTFVVWKKIYLEQPKILKNVKFPSNTWTWVKKHLEKLNIECEGPLKPVVLNPADPSIYFYFYNQKKNPLRGKDKNARYGPEGYGPMKVMLGRLNTMYSDNNPSTINIFIFGSISKNKDLIRNTSSSISPDLQPVDYNHFYSKGEIDLQEWSAYGTGRSMEGTSPAIFIWSDFWWLASKIINTSHEKSLARVILHELGHQLLMFKSGGEEGIIDSTGHLDFSLITRRSIMTGSSITRLNQKAQLYISSASMKLERQFINNPFWHPKVEMLIRRDYIPPKE